jgi:hypothetical protein
MKSPEFLAAGRLQTGRSLLTTSDIQRALSIAFPALNAGAWTLAPSEHTPEQALPDPMGYLPMSSDSQR